MTPPQLSVVNHDRDVTGMTYVYPVVSRRAGGVSIGINLNPNNACNWRCAYCQVPDLSFGKAPRIDLALLESELAQMLQAVVHGDFMAASVPPEYRRFNDVALSGNGEPTTSAQIGEVIALIGRQLALVRPVDPVKIVLITNGSMMNKRFVHEALQTLGGLNGEVWFKLDAATTEGLSRVNGVTTTPEQHLRRLTTAAELCPTWIQTCLFGQGKDVPRESELVAYLAALEQLRRRDVGVRGVLLYTLARPSLQPGGEQLQALARAWLDAVAKRIEALGWTVKVSA